MKITRTNRVVLIGVSILLLYFIFTKVLSHYFPSEVVLIEIDENTPAQTFEIFSKKLHPHAMGGSSRLFWDDTILINGVKRPATDTSYESKAYDFYDDTIRMSFDPYKATKIIIKEKFVFYGSLLEQ